MTQIIAFAGNKQSGKTTSCNFMLALKLVELGIATNARINTSGLIEVSDIGGENPFNSDFFVLTDQMLNDLYDQGLSNYIKMYAFADPLKDICVSLLGLTKNQVFGSDEEKNSLTNISWEDMPGNKKRKGKMTAREVMQFVGTDIFRKMKNDIWIESILNRIKADSPEIAVISDVRFLNETEALLDVNAYIVALTRNMNPDAEHASEKDIPIILEKANFVIDNQNLDIRQHNLILYTNLSNQFPDIIPIFGQ